MNRPLTWFVVSWIAGSAASFQWPQLHVPVWLTVIAGISALFVWLLRLPGGWLGAALLLLFASCGYTDWRDSRNVTGLSSLAEHMDELSGSEVKAEGRIASAVDVDGDRAVFVLQAASLTLGETRIAPMEERMRVSVRLLEKEDQQLAKQWERGDHVELDGGVLLRPEPSRNFGGFDYRRYLRHQHIHWLISSKGMEQVNVTKGEQLQLAPSTLLLWNDRLRAGLAERMDTIFPSDQSGLMKSMLIGWQEDMNPEQYSQFSKLGLTHILAISGMNVAIFLGLVFGLLKLLRVTKETSLWVGIALMPGYIVLTGASPSIVRAGLVAMLALYAARRGWLKDGLNLTALAAWAMLAWEPYYLFDVGFQLSFLITAALLIGVSRVSRLLPFRHERVKQAAAITIVSQIVSFPVTVTYFNGFSMLSWLANTMFVPIFSLLLFPSALIALFVGLLVPPAGQPFGSLSGLLSRATVWAIEKMADIDGFQLIWPTPSPVWTVLYFAGFVMLYRALAARVDAQAVDAERRPIWPISAATAGLVLLLYYGYTPDRFNRTGWVEFLDVGQGDSALIRTPAGKYMLVDGGGTLTFRKPGEEWKERRKPFEVGRSVVVPLLKHRGVHKLDYVISTHEDIDHLGGLQAVAEEIPIGKFVFNGTLKSEAKVEQLFRTLLDKKVPLISSTTLRSIELDRHSKLSILPGRAGEPDPALRLAAKQNNESIVFLLQMSGYRWLFTGDMEKSQEVSVLSALRSHPDYSRGEGAPVDVMKVAHHGSKTSTTDMWLQRWQPKLAVISVGARNSYGHPSPDVVERLEAGGADLLRTDLNGAVRMAAKPNGLRIETKLSAFGSE
ncbi:DNA internalization-related competence protein ComEC/Rec2 [Paenibacillus chartarius]|uniref:DNA internalization-related competence protein ComEC/Rec2 n=1 Tax=Paenibacillus chartarius TaxID=747481 RepID=A0ABV6DT54_9BACL